MPVLPSQLQDKVMEVTSFGARVTMWRHMCTWSRWAAWRDVTLSERYVVTMRNVCETTLYSFDRRTEDTNISNEYVCRWVGIYLFTYLYLGSIGHNVYFF
jgi:hypothetical protein